MKFTLRQFSERFPPVECALFVMHEEDIRGRPYIEYRGAIPPSVHALSYRATGAALILPSGMVYVGISVCSPGDQFVRATGRAKAIGRAYQNARKGFTVGHQFTYADGPEFIEAVKVCIREHIAAKKADMGLQ